MQSMSEGVGCDLVRYQPPSADPCPIGTPWCVGHSDEIDGVGCEGPIWDCGRHFGGITGAILIGNPGLVEVWPVFGVYAEHVRTPDSIRQLLENDARDVVTVLQAGLVSQLPLNELEHATVRILVAALDYHDRSQPELDV